MTLSHRTEPIRSNGHPRAIEKTLWPFCGFWEMATRDCEASVCPAGEWQNNAMNVANKSSISGCKCEAIWWSRQGQTRSVARSERGFKKDNPCTWRGLEFGKRRGGDYASKFVLFNVFCPKSSPFKHLRCCCPRTTVTLRYQSPTTRVGQLRTILRTAARNRPRK